MLTDKNQREQAINANASYIIQAPAGSGKTELLTQRFLNVLSRVKRPEEIIAITFTRKAASEMRERILQALIDSKTLQQPTDSEHKKLTWQLANNAMQQNERQQWHLLQHPNRLRIQTIDSLCHNLIQKTPTLSQNNAYAEIESDCSQLYYQAAKNCLNDALSHPQYSQAAVCLLEHLDNQQSRTIQLIAHQLAHRDQWLSLVMQSYQTPRAYFDQVIQLIQTQAVDKLQQTIKPAYQIPLCQVVNYAAGNVETTHVLRCLETLNSKCELSLKTAYALSDFFLTQNNEIRKKFTKNQGICAPSSIKESQSKKIAQHQKNTLNELIGLIKQDEHFIQALIEIKHIPLSSYTDQQWSVITALLQLLPLAVAQLSVCFSQANRVDFTAISQQANRVLGEAENPTDLTLILDNQIKHLMLDEFQDTSVQQFELVEKLISGWSPGDGKSLFIVGDPMQSIYRFRQAEVALFLRVRQHGIANLSLTPLDLSSNFRSSPEIIAWVNRQFSQIFPQQDELFHGAVSYKQSFAVQQNNDEAAIKAFACEDSVTQAEQIITLIKEHQTTYPDKRIGILVRSRNQLKEIIPALNAANIAFQGVDIDNLSRNGAIEDIWSLTKALLVPSDKIAWLALLRSPLCGLSIKDIHAIVTHNHRQSILQNMAEVNEREHIEDPKRLQQLSTTLFDALKQRQRHNLSDWINTLWHQLGGHLLIDLKQRHNIEAFYQLLDKHQQHGTLADPTRFEQQLSVLFSQSDQAASVQVMTIHKSKGLEFDCVILPGINSVSSQQDSALMCSLEITHKKYGVNYLLSTIKAHDQDYDPIYDYIKHIEKIRESYENQRLFYVAATRAKNQLYLLTDSHTPSSMNNFYSLITQQNFTTITASKNKSLVNRSYPIIRHVAPLPTVQVGTAHLNQGNRINLQTKNLNKAKIQGIFNHLLLQLMTEQNCNSPDSLNSNSLSARCKELGIINDSKLINTAKKTIKKLWDNDEARVILNTHSPVHAELSIIQRSSGQLNTYVVDKTFIAQGTRWIIDYKTNYDELREDSYQEQVNHYASLFQAMESLPIKCVLFYLNNNSLKCWDYFNASSR